MTDTAPPAPPPGRRPMGRPAPQPSRLILSLVADYTRPNMISTLRRTLRQLPRVEDNTVWPYILGSVGRSNAQQDSGLLTACLWAHY
jgi:hypothetical protein